MHRHGLLAAASASRLATNVLDTGETYDIPLAEHGFSMLVTVTRNGHDHHLLFDAGMTPDGLSENMRRLGLSPFDIELVVLSHGHSDHVTGLDGFIRTVGPSNLPLVLHPGAFTKRRIAIPGLLELELPSPSRAALQQAGTQASRLLIIDLQAVTYFGSAGLNAVLDCHRRGLQAGTSVRLVADSGLVVRPIEVTNLDSVLELYPTLPDALQGRDTKQGQ